MSNNKISSCFQLTPPGSNALLLLNERYELEKKNYIHIHIYEKGQTPQVVAITKRTNTSPTFTWLLGAFGPRVSAKSFRRLGETLSSFFDSCCQMLKASQSPHTTYTTCPEPFRNLKQVRVRVSLSRSRSRSQAYRQGYDHGLKCPKVPPHVAYQRTSLYGTHTQ